MLHTLEYSTINSVILNGTQRRVLLRGICADSTIAITATNVLSAVPPADLHAREPEMGFQARRADRVMGSEPQPRAATLRVWAIRLRERTNGAWTRQLIPDIEVWCRLGYVSLECYMTQIMSRPGCFSGYLHKIAKENSRSCYHCGCLLDDAAHTLLDCPDWETER